MSISDVIATAQTVVKVVQYGVWVWQMYQTYSPITTRQAISSNYVIVEKIPASQNTPAFSAIEPFEIRDNHFKRRHSI